MSLVTEQEPPGRVLRLVRAEGSAVPRVVGASAHAGPRQRVFTTVVLGGAFWGLGAGLLWVLEVVAGRL